MAHGPILPIKLNSATNGEYAPQPVGRAVAHARGAVA